MVNTINSQQTDNFITLRKDDKEETVKIGFQGTIQITDSISRKQLFTKVIHSEQEGNDFFDQYNQTVKPSHFTKFSLILGPYKNATEFFKNLFLPTCFFKAKLWVFSTLSAHAIGMCILLNLLNVVYALFDLVTLPIRLLITPFKLFYDTVIAPSQLLPIEQFLTKEASIKKEDLPGTYILAFATHNLQISDLLPNEHSTNRIAKLNNSARFTAIFTHNLPCEEETEFLGKGINLFKEYTGAQKTVWQHWDEYSAYKYYRLDPQNYKAILHRCLGTDFKEYFKEEIETDERYTKMDKALEENSQSGKV